MESRNREIVDEVRLRPYRKKISGSYAKIGLFTGLTLGGIPFGTYLYYNVEPDFGLMAGIFLGGMGILGTIVSIYNVKADKKDLEKESKNLEKISQN